MKQEGDKENLHERLLRAEELLARSESRLKETQSLARLGSWSWDPSTDTALWTEELYSILGRDPALPAGDPRLEDVEAIMEAGNSGAALTRQLLAFGRPQAPAPGPLDLNAAIDGMRRRLGRLAGEKYEIVFTPGPGLAPVKADPNQLEQVLMNLALNSRDAMPAGGRLLIETENILLERELREGLGRVPAGRYVRLAVTDKGSGIDAALLPRIFEPFFTTKASGKGTGLGLSIVQWIIAMSNGHITVRSAPGEGTNFSIYLPHAEEKPL